MRNKVHWSQKSQQNVHKQPKDQESVTGIILGTVSQLCLAGAVDEGGGGISGMLWRWKKETDAETQRHTFKLPFISYWGHIVVKMCYCTRTKLQDLTAQTVNFFEVLSIFS